jgi:hypothetical protein
MTEDCYKIICVVLTSIGLILDIVGVCMLFKWEPPLSGYDKKGNLMVVMSPNDDMKKEFKKNKTYSTSAIWCLILGFVFQITSTILSLHK